MGSERTVFLARCHVGQRSGTETFPRWGPTFATGQGYNEKMTSGDKIIIIKIIFCIAASSRLQAGDDPLP